jgi:hypothetical protein
MKQEASGRRMDNDVFNVETERRGGNYAVVQNDKVLPADDSVITATFSASEGNGPSGQIANVGVGCF